MSEPTGCCACPPHRDHCDVLVGLEGLHVVDVNKTGSDVLVVTVESAPAAMGCPTCGVVAHSHGRRTVTMVDTPCFGRPTRVRWRKRTWECVEPSCPLRVFTEHNDQVGRRRGLLTTRARRWAIDQFAGEHASVLGIARQLGVAWKTLWGTLEAILASFAAPWNESRVATCTCFLKGSPRWSSHLL